jgi:glycosyltransferase involved in cell wall biosynthesis
MKIIYISSAAVPSRTANSIHVMKMCQAMEQNGHEVTLVAPKSRGEFKLDDISIWQHYGIKNKFEIKWLPSPSKYGIFLYSLLSAWLSRKYDLVYSRHLYSAMFASKLRQPVIFETHDVPEGRLGPFFFRVLYNSQHLKKIIVISNALKRLLKKSYPELPLKTVCVFPDGVDLERFNVIESPSIAQASLKLRGLQKFVAGYAGHLYKGRGIEIIISMAEKFPKISFLILGGNPEDIDFWKKKVLQANRNIYFMGFIPNGDLPMYLLACEVLLMPYQRKVTVSGGKGDTSQWMSPMKMFEYMACERPIIASDLPSLREILNSRNSILVSPDNISEWENALTTLCHDECLRRKLSQQARKDVEPLSWVQRVAHILERRHWEI